MGTMLFGVFKAIGVLCIGIIAVTLHTRDPVTILLKEHKDKIPDFSNDVNLIKDSNINQVGYNTKEQKVISITDGDETLRYSGPSVSPSNCNRCRIASACTIWSTIRSVFNALCSVLLKLNVLSILSGVILSGVFCSMISKHFTTRQSHPNSTVEENLETAIYKAVYEGISELEKLFDEMEERNAMWMNYAEDQIESVSQHLKGESDVLKSETFNQESQVKQFVSNLHADINKQALVIVFTKNSFTHEFSSLKSEVELLKRSFEKEKSDIASTILETSEKIGRKQVEMGTEMSKIRETSLQKDLHDGMIAAKLHKGHKILKTVRRDCDNQYAAISSQLLDFKKETDHQIKLLNEKNASLECSLSEYSEQFLKKLYTIETRFSSLTNPVCRNENAGRMKSQIKSLPCGVIKHEDVVQWLHSSCPLVGASNSMSEAECQRHLLITSHSPLARAIVENSELIIHKMKSLE